MPVAWVVTGRRRKKGAMPHQGSMAVTGVRSSCGQSEPDYKLGQDGGCIKGTGPIASAYVELLQLLPFRIAQAADPLRQQFIDSPLALPVAAHSIALATSSGLAPVEGVDTNVGLKEVARQRLSAVAGVCQADVLQIISRTSRGLRRRSCAAR